MKRIALIAVTALAAPAAACQSTEIAPPAVAALEAAEEADAVYVFHVLDTNRFEIEAARVALKRARNHEVRSFAEMMIRDHSANLSTFRSLASRLAAPDPDQGLSEPKAQMLESLRATSPDEFDAGYVQSQITSHEEALLLHRRFAAEGESEALRQFASRTAPLVETHLEQARRIAALLDRPSS